MSFTTKRIVSSRDVCSYRSRVAPTFGDEISTTAVLKIQLGVQSRNNLFFIGFNNSHYLIYERKLFLDLTNYSGQMRQQCISWEALFAWQHSVKPPVIWNYFLSSQYCIWYYAWKLSVFGTFIDCSQSPIFSWHRRDIARLTVNGGYLDFQMYRGGGRRGL